MWCYTENSQNQKANDDHDSGTESDDESANIEELQKYMENSILLGSSNSRGTRSQFLRRGSTGEVTSVAGVLGVVGGHEMGGDGSTFNRQPSSRASKTDMDSPLPEAALDSALPSDSDHNFDHHSSEEELEVINCVGRERNASGGSGVSLGPVSLTKGGSAGTTGSSGQVAPSSSTSLSSQYPEKRKWSQANGGGTSFGENSGSSDEEIKDLVCFSTPVEFRTSPPANVHKPSRSLSPPPKVFHSANSANIPPVELCSVSPRKRHRRTNAAAANATASANIQRPSLDFEKMQQIRVRLV